MIADAISFPRKSDDWLTTLLIGAVLGFLSFLIIPGLILQGYLLRVARAGATGDEQPPAFGDWIELLVDGVKAFVVAFVYGILPATIFVTAISVLAGGAILSAVSGNEGAAAGFGVLIAVVVLVMIPVVLLIVYLTITAQVRLAVTGELNAAFQVGTVTRIAFDAEFFVAFLLAVVVGIGLSIVGGILTIVLVGLLILFYAQMSMYYLFGRGYGAATDGGATPV
ncbi:MAG: DUF4013 domain-containing protein [Halovenus sp.]